MAYRSPLEIRVGLVANPDTPPFSNRHHPVSCIAHERVPGDGGSDNIPVDLGQTFSAVNIYDPTAGTGIQSTYTNTKTLTLHLTDHPLVLALKTAVTSGNSASFVKLDSTTKGNWSGVYGADGYNVRIPIP
jgi:hypothetical protein